ncbi:MAG: ABC transporter ATP-binding protein [Clostridia bacterium]|nr:ABC transporter ATP-binding protein [Clostridia bacterium]
MIKVKNISKYYGKSKGAENVSFEVKKNEITGLLGRNGAGKTTTLNIITGYIAADFGSVEIEGYDIQKKPRQAKAKIGYLPEKPPIYTDMTVDEYLFFCAELKGVDTELAEKHVDEICSITGISEVRSRLCGNLSKGYTQRLGMAQALIGNPPILILDEPTIGLDPKQIVEIRELIKNLSNNHTVLISSHVLSEIDKICSKIIIMDKGAVAAYDTLENLTNIYGSAGKMNLRVKGADSSFEKELKKIDGVNSTVCGEENEQGISDYSITYSKDRDINEQVFDLATKKNIKILEMKSKVSTLEDVFLNIVGKDKEKLN